MITSSTALATISIVCDDRPMAAPRELSPSSRTLTVTLTPAQVAALARATFTDTSARPAVEKNAAESAVRKLQAEARNAGRA
jgi:hypothetical protein